MTSEPTPQRLSDADRDAAAALLRDHYEAGRLDQAELDERLAAALAARVSSDLTPLFADLPEPHPAAGETTIAWATPAASGLAPRPDASVPATKGTDWIKVARASLWPVAILLAVTTGNFWTFIMLAIVGSIILSQINKNQRQPPPWLPPSQQ